MADNLSKYLHLETKQAADGFNFRRVIQAMAFVEVEKTIPEVVILFGYDEAGKPSTIICDVQPTQGIWPETLRWIEWLRAVCDEARKDPAFLPDYSAQSVLRRLPKEEEAAE